MSWIRQPFFTLFLFPLAANLTGLRTGCQSLKNVDFSVIRPLNSVSHLWGCMPVLAIVFVGQCEVFVCLGFVSLFLLFLFPLAAKLIGPRTGCQSLKTSIFPAYVPLIQCLTYGTYVGFGDRFCRTV